MTRKLVWLFTAITAALILAPVTFAQAAGGAAKGPVDWVDFAAALGLGLAAAGGGLGQGRATARLARAPRVTRERQDRFERRSSSAWR